MNNKWILGLLLLIILVNLGAPVLAQDNPQVTLQLFWGKGCPHCEAERAFLKDLVLDYPYLQIQEFEIYNNKTNRDLFQKIADKHSIEIQGVPTTFIDKEVIVGYLSDSTTGKQITGAIQACYDEQCNGTALVDKCKANVPILGEVNLCESSLPMLTIILGAFDGFNPCAFFVLLFLLSLLIHAKSRARMLAVGLSFVFFSGLVYFMFMAAWFQFFLVAGNKQLITAIAGGIAVVIALINIKDFFLFKKGVSLTISDKSKQKLFKRMRGLIGSTSIIKMIAAAVVLAVFANLYELLCTVGLPMIYTRALTLRQLPTFGYYMYLILYNVVYVIPLFTIVMIFTVTMGAKKLSVEMGQSLKLMSGLMMLGLGLVLLLKPEALNEPFVAIGLILGVIVFSGIFYFSKGVAKRIKGGKNG